MVHLTRKTWTPAEIDALMIEAEAVTPFGPITNMAMAAQENAATMVYEEKTAPESELMSATLASLCDLLSSRDADKEAVAWFVARGVQY